MRATHKLAIAAALLAGAPLLPPSRHTPPRTKCAQCGCQIPPGKPGRKCRDCRQEQRT